ncbi:MAG: glycoside hydrolase family 88 protein [Spirochaetales bacterium]|nr:glycoside hydrolase family 88 protein [Spirochaetales bacterium]
MGKSKVITTIMLVLLACCSYELCAASCGDVNANGNVDIVDALLIAQYYVGLNPANFDDTAANANGDSTINIVDALLVARFYVGLISALSCPDETPPQTDPVWSGGPYTLNGTSDYVDLPDGITGDLDDFSVACWVRLNSLDTWSRIFDFGVDTNVFMMLTPASGDTGYPYFCITTSGNSGEQGINGTGRMSTGSWQHLAVVMSGNTGILYINTQEAGRNTGITLNPSDLGNTTNNYIGRSQWSDDPYLNAGIDDFVVYDRALSASEVSALGSTPPADITPEPTAVTTPVPTGAGNIDPAVCDSAGNVANRIAYNTLNRGPTDTYYAVACVWYGTLVYAGLTQDSTLINGSVNLYPGSRPTGSVDDNIFGIWALELYRQTNTSRYRDDGVYLADEEFNPPNSNGLCKYTRYWVDDLWMICSLQTQAYKATGDTKYLDRCRLQFEAYFNTLQQSNGLFHHTRNAPYFWGRGNGWAASAMTEILMVMPQSHSGYTPIMNAYTRMMSALAGYQDSGGMWHQVITESSSYLETSCTGMFLFAISTGIRMGWLSESEYLPVVERGFRALAGYVNANGEVSNICIGTGEGSSLQFYFDRPRSTGDYHGQAAVIWAATGVMQLCD